MVIIYFVYISLYIFILPAFQQQQQHLQQFYEKRFSPVCPQRLPDIANQTAALERMPKGRLEYLKRLLPYLQNQSEDCLYLNIYVPIQGKSFYLKCIFV